MRTSFSPVIFAAGLAVLLCSSRSDADPVRITFDQLSPGAHGSGDYFSQGLVLASMSKGSGDEPYVGTFGGYEVGAAAGATTSPNIAFGARADFSPGIWAQFVEPADPFHPSQNIVWTDYLSFSIVSRYSDQTAPWRVAIHGGPGFHLLDERLGVGDGQVIFSRERPDIQAFQLFTTSSQQVGMDTLEFNTPAVPEPGTLLLFGSGIAAVVTRRIRNRRGGADSGRVTD